MCLEKQNDSSGVHQRSQICRVARFSNQRVDPFAEAAVSPAENCGSLWVSLWQVLVVYRVIGTDRIASRSPAGLTRC